MRTPSRIMSGAWWKQLAWSASIVLLAGCARSIPPEQLTFADPGNPIASLIYIAETQGFFKDEDLSVGYNHFSSGRDALTSVLGGESDFAVGTEFPFANMILQGKDLRILCAIERTNQNAAVVARRDRGIETAADLTEKRVGLAPNTSSDYMLSVMLREAGVATESVTWVPVKPEDMATTLEQGKVDAVATWNPYVGDAQARFAENATVTLRTSAYTELSLLGTRPETLPKKDEAFRRLIKALVRAESFVVDNNDAALQIVVKHFGPDDEAPLRYHWPNLNLYVRLDNLLLTSLANEGEWLARRATPSPAVPDYRASLAPRYLESVQPQSVTIEASAGE